MNKDIRRDSGVAAPAVRRRGWRRIHHSWLFWAGFVLLSVAITFYVFSIDLSWRRACLNWLPSSIACYPASEAKYTNPRL